MPQTKLPKVRRGRRIAVLLLGAPATACALMSLASFGGSMHWVLALLSHLRVQYLLVLVLLSACLFAMRSHRLAIPIAIVGLINAGDILPVYAPRDTPPSSGQRYRATMVNVYTANQEHDKVLRYLRSEDPDFILLTEVDLHWRPVLDALGERYPHHVEELGLGNFGIAFYSRLPATELSIRTVGGRGYPPPSVFATLMLQGRPLFVMGTHPLPPTKESQAISRDDQLAALGKLAAEHPGPLMILGDLNTTSYAGGFNRLLEQATLTDSRQGFGVHATWPASKPSILRIPIDHCLVSSDIVVTDRRVGPHVGSDHLPVTIEFELTP